MLWEAVSMELSNGVGFRSLEFTSKVRDTLTDTRKPQRLKRTVW